MVSYKAIVIKERLAGVVAQATIHLGIFDCLAEALETMEIFCAQNDITILNRQMRETSATITGTDDGVWTIEIEEDKKRAKERKRNENLPYLSRERSSDLLTGGVALLLLWCFFG